MSAFVGRDDDRGACHGFASTRTTQAMGIYLTLLAIAVLCLEIGRSKGNSMTSIIPHRSFARRGSVAALALAVLASTLPLLTLAASATALEPGTTCATPITSAPTGP